jgi:7-cyano-7-deazaguanine synthase
MGAVVLLSGGLDSTVAAALHRQAGGSPGLGLFVDYGQRAAVPERAAALAVGRALGFPVVETSLALLAAETTTALVARGAALPHPAPEALDSDAARETAAAVWVPNRNGVLVNLAAALAEARGLREVVVGFNAEEAATFPDNGAAFVERVNAALELSTRGTVRVVAPVLGASKAELLALGRQAGAPVELAWSCYEAGPLPCGCCVSCRRRERAERLAGG